MSDESKKVRTAEQAIRDILAQLEKDTDAVVDRIELVDIELTAISDDRPQWLRHVRIETKRRPGTRWS